MSESEKEQNTDFSESVNRLNEIRSENEDLIQQIIDLNTQINEGKINLQITLNYLTSNTASVDAMKVAPELLPPVAEKEMIEPIPEHQLILVGKINALDAKNEQIEKGYSLLKDLDEKYKQLLNDEIIVKTNILLAQQQLSDYEVLRKCNSEEIAFLNNHKKERKREVQHANSLLSELQKAYNQVVKRRESEILDSKNDLTKEIVNKQAEIVSLEEKITGVRQRLYSLKQHSDQLDAERKIRNEQDKRCADWATEKQNLQKTLTELKSQLNQLRVLERTRQSLPNDSIDSEEKLSSSQEEKYGSLLRAWSGKVGSVQPAEGSLKQIWEKIQEPRKELAQILEDNAMKERQLMKKKKALDRKVKVFRDTEMRNAEEMKETEESFKKAEEKLLKKIKAAKIIIAQNKLKKL